MSEAWDGRQGQQNQQDQPGLPGQKGPPAWQSQQGAPGQQGWSGPQGQQGWSGPQGQQGWSGPQDQQAWSGTQGKPAAAGPRSSGRRGPLLIGAAGGLVLAVLIGAVLLLTGAIRVESADEAAVDTRPVALPVQLAGFTDRDDAADAKSSKDSARRRAMTSRTNARTIQQYSAAYGGAGVGVRSYADADLQFLPTVVAVRAPAGGLTVGPDPDPADLGMGAPRQQVITERDVQCLIVNVEVVPKDKQPDPDRQTTSICRRTDAHFTVDVIGSGQGPEGRQQMIKLTEAAFAAAVDGQAG